MLTGSLLPVLTSKVSNVDGSSAAEILARALRDDRLVALVGSGTSATSTDANGRVYEGLPTPREFVNLASKQFRYISPSQGFTSACDMILKNEQRTGLEDILLRYYRVPEAIEPPPAHRLLSWLPFSLYITSNYDQFIERALERESRRPYVLIENTDLVRLKRWNTPVIKYHGCVTRPTSLISTTSDYDDLADRRALIRQFIAVSLVGKTLLVVGHGLSDSDLVHLLNDVLANLHDYAPNIIVLREWSDGDRLPRFDYPHEIVGEDLTQFLNRLLHEYRALQQVDQPPIFEETWITSAFFAQLRQAAVLPSETQVIDAFLSHLVEELLAREDPQAVLQDAQTAVDSALIERPNYGALRRTWLQLRAQLDDITDKTTVETIVDEFISTRSRKIQLFTRVGRQIVNANDRILLYSQSQRVLQALRGVPVNIQRTCHLFIAECRPKSPNPYQDAAAICRELAGTHYSLTVCPDVVAINLLATRQIDQIVLGTHALYVDELNAPLSTLHSFVNTCGSIALAAAAHEYDVPVRVIGERLKLEQVSYAERFDYLHPHEENDLLQSAVGIRELRTQRDEVGHLNVGYDLIEIRDGIDVRIPDLEI